MQEIWKDIPNYKNYQISNFGNVYSKKRHKILKPYTNIHNYLIVNLNNGNKRKQFQVHRLVACFFIPNPDNLPCVNHMNGNKQDNKVENLEWCSYSHNTKHAYKTGLIATTPVIQYSLEGDFIRKWTSIIDASNNLHIKKAGIVNCCKHRSKTSGGFVWRYANE